ncbi:hypothetical protein CEXT_324851 [Caerostris extrusa]|uniref:Uncharacterized protein n=1 Tax=Caerostris extrusa TaxID=172846 RepID=A0AAV4TSU7_CAEEX|nr:hypothetical protein CEXT_324851 [Caerostris extrusa]
MFSYCSPMILRECASHNGICNKVPEYEFPSLFPSCCSLMMPHSIRMVCSISPMDLCGLNRTSMVYGRHHASQHRFAINVWAGLVGVCYVSVPFTIFMECVLDLLVEVTANMRCSRGQQDYLVAIRTGSIFKQAIPVSMD